MLSTINVLDKGFVSLLSASNNGKTLKTIEDEYFGTKINKDLLNIANATFIIKMPLFVQTFLSQFNLDITVLPVKEEPEAYIPDESEIHTGKNDDDREVVTHIKETTEALFLSSKGYQQDNCDKFMSQVITPISVYTKVIVHGDIMSWLKFLKRKKLPHPIEVYRKAVEDLLKIEWKDVEQYKKGAKL